MTKSHVFLIVVSLSSPSQGLTIAGYPIERVAIEGVLICNLNGEPHSISNATVFLTCGGRDSTTSIAQAVTDTNGAYRIVLTWLETLTFNPSYCGLGVNIPAGACTFISPESTLYIPLELVNIVSDNNIITAVFSPPSNNITL